MDPASLAIGVVGIAGLFNNAIDCFGYIRLARSFGNNYETSVLRLDNARLKLSRWGESVGLSGGGINDVTRLSFSTISEEDVDHATRILENILDLFDQSYKVSNKYAGKCNSDGQNLSPTVGWLHQKMQQLSTKRKNSASLSRKVKWAVWQEADLRKLIGDITKLTEDLTELFPGASNEQSRLAELEAAEFSEALRVLNKTLEGHDQALTAAIHGILQKADELHNYTNNNSKISAQGNISGSHTFNMS